MAASRTRSVVFIDDVTVTRRMNLEAHRRTVSAQVEPNAEKVIGWCRIT